MADSTDELWAAILRDYDFWSDLLNDTDFWHSLERLSPAESATLFLERTKKAGFEDTRAVHVLRAELLGLTAGLVQQVGLERAQQMLRTRTQ